MSLQDKKIAVDWVEKELKNISGSIQTEDDRERFLKLQSLYLKIKTKFDSEILEYITHYLNDGIVYKK